MSADRSVSKLIDDLADHDRLVRISAISKLSDFGQAAQDAVPELTTLLDDEAEPYIRLVTAGAICRIDPNEAEGVLPVLLAELHDNDFMNRDAACKFIGEIGFKAQAAIPTLLKLLEDESETVRCSSAEAIGQISGDWAHAIEVGLTLVQHPDWLIRVVGAEHFQAIGIQAKAAIPRLRELLGCVEWQVRLDLEEVLNEIEAR